MKNLFTILVISIVGLSCSSLLNRNTIKVESSSDVSINNIKIEHGISATTINRTSDELLFKNRDRYDIIYVNGKTKTLKNEYGENDFLITYKDSLYLAFRQFKTNRRNNHSYKFKFTKENEKYFLEVHIKGENDLSFKNEMKPIHKSYKYLGNQLRNNYFENSKICFENITNYIQESDEFITLNNKLFQRKNDKTVYILTCDYEGQIYLRKLKDIIDFTTAKKKGQFWIDKNNVFGNFFTSDGEMLYEISEADVNSFQNLGKSVYGKDEKFIYDTRHGKINNADVKTFVPMYRNNSRSFAWAKDKNNYYFWDQIIEDTLEFKRYWKIE